MLMNCFRECDLLVTILSISALDNLGISWYWAGLVMVEVVGRWFMAAKIISKSCFICSRLGLISSVSTLTGVCERCSVPTDFRTASLISLGEGKEKVQAKTEDCSCETSTYLASPAIGGRAVIV